MPQPIKISLDVMGGDHGASVVIPGAALALKRRPQLSYLMYGDEAQVRPLLEKFPELNAVTTFIHTEVAIQMDDKPSQALRRGRLKSSMWGCIQAVKDGTAAAAVSAGNTGALMAMAKVCLKTITPIERPVIACIWPTLRGESIVLDVGATIGADAYHLVDMAVLGAAMAQIVLGKECPTVGLLNVGTEEIKGLDNVKEASRILKETASSGFEYKGFVEGDDIGKGSVDVVVTEGFTGNIALKTAEGTAKQLGSLLRSAMTRSWMAKIGYIFAKRAFDVLKEKLDPRRANGGVFLGLEGIVIKSHGGTDALGFACAIEIAYDMAQHDLIKTIRGLFEAQLASKTVIREGDTH